MHLDEKQHCLEMACMFMSTLSFISLGKVKMRKNSAEEESTSQ